MLDTAAAMLEEMPVSEVGLNELSRRVGLAKSALSRYFESREAVLIALLDHSMQAWVAELPNELGIGSDADLGAEERAAHLADALSRSLAARPVLCDLFGAQAGVLEHNIGLEVAQRHKRVSLDVLAAMTDTVREHVPELGEGAQDFCLLAMILAGALSAYCPPPAAVTAAYEADPSLAVLSSELGDALRRSLRAAMLGALPRTS
ncbi:TetR family transcriptional regulator [Actinosynnema sp.]|uniref:TetR family transcriptional regulator n=1 Tax=Actinosynnema sp. TaxID=1872144 RepID=UPI003F82F220